jgi:hypothetical protein
MIFSRRQFKGSLYIPKSKYIISQKQKFQMSFNEKSKKFIVFLPQQLRK